MRDSHERGHQAMVDKAAGEVVAAIGCIPAEITPYQVARHLGCEPNSALYARVRDCRRRRQEKMGLATIYMPAGAETEFRAIFEHLTRPGVGHFVRTVRMVGVDRTAVMRVADAERRRVEVESETAEVLDLCQMAEVGLTVVTVRIVPLEDALAEAQRREDMLRGRLEQREAHDAVRDTTAGPEEIAVAAGAAEPLHSDAVDADTPVQQQMPFRESDGASE